MIYVTGHILCGNFSRLLQVALNIYGAFESHCPYKFPIRQLQDNWTALFTLNAVWYETEIILSRNKVKCVRERQRKHAIFQLLLRLKSDVLVLPYSSFQFLQHALPLSAYRAYFLPLYLFFEYFPPLLTNQDTIFLYQMSSSRNKVSLKTSRWKNEQSGGGPDSHCLLSQNWSINCDQYHVLSFDT